jgi:NAD(P)-dependent dehydrogenase (short-subunit alcohol dehydrogenase family)
MEMTRENIQNLFSLKGKRALIIGGAGGIGLAIAKAYVMVGADVVMADKNEELLGQSQALLQAENLSMTTQVVDITDVESVSSLGTYIKETGGVDILVNSAAITEREPVLEMDVETWASIIDVNLHGSYYVAKEVDGWYLSIQPAPIELR